MPIESDLPQPRRRRGRRDNGLDAASYVEVRDVDPRVGEELLHALRDAGVAAYLEPKVSNDPYLSARSLPSPPVDRLWIDRDAGERAAPILDQPDLEHAPASSANSAGLGGSRADSGRGDRLELDSADVDARFAELVALFGQPSDVPDRRDRTARAAVSAPTDDRATDRDRTDDDRQTFEYEDEFEDAYDVEGEYENEGDEPDAAESEDETSDRASDVAPSHRRSTDQTDVVDDAEDAEKTAPRTAVRPVEQDIENDVNQDIDRGSDHDPAIWRGPTGALGPAADDPAEHYNPPEPPPVRLPSVQAQVGILAVVLGAVLLFYPSLLSINQSVCQVLGFLGILGGAGLLLMRLRPGPLEDDDDGAVV